MEISRRSLLMSALTPAPAQGKLVDTHVHLFDPTRFPYHPSATYQPKPETLDDYAKAVPGIGLDHAIVVHPEPYQDDHRYLEYCFQNEPRKGFFKGTVLFDGADPAVAALADAEADGPHVHALGLALGPALEAVHGQAEGEHPGRDADHHHAGGSDGLWPRASG